MYDRRASSHDERNDLKLFTPLGQRALFYGPPKEPTTITVAKSPLGICLFLRRREIPLDPFYGPDENGWLGYLFPPGEGPGVTSLELFNWALANSYEVGFSERSEGEE